MQTEGPLRGVMNLVPVDMKGEMHKRLAKNVKERNMAKARLKTWDEDKMVAANVGANGEEGPAKKTRRSGAGKKRAAGGGTGRKGYREVASSRGGRRGSFGSESSEEEDEADDRRARVRASARRGKGEEEGNGKGEYQNDGFVVCVFSCAFAFALIVVLFSLSVTCFFFVFFCFTGGRLPLGRVFQWGPQEVEVEIIPTTSLPDALLG